MSILIWISAVLIALFTIAMIVRAAISDREAVTVFSIGGYVLNTPIAGLSGLDALSPEECSTGRTFKDETIYKAPPVEFLRHLWEMRIGAVGGMIYKLNPCIALSDRVEAQKVSADTLRYCMEKLGKPTWQKKGFFIWGAPYGSVTLKVSEGVEGFSVSIIATSTTVAAFRHLG